MDTSYSISIFKITKQEAIANAGATGICVLPGTPVKNVQPESKLISINITDGSRLRYIHTCNLDIEVIPEKEDCAHKVSGLFHTSLILISVLCDAGCKVQYVEKYVACIIISK